MARPSKYSATVAADICARLAGGEALSAICTEDGMPGLSTVYRWLQDNESFRDLYARAREDQADTLADEILKIADTPMLGEKVTIEPSGERKVVEGDMIEHRRLQVDARKWIAAKLKPKKYGDRIEQEVTVNQGTVSAEPLSPDEWEKQHGAHATH